MRNKKFVSVEVGKYYELDGTLEKAIETLNRLFEKVPEKYRKEARLSLDVETERHSYSSDYTCTLNIEYFEDKSEEDLAKEKAQSEEYKRQVRERDLKTIEELKRKHGLC